MVQSAVRFSVRPNSSCQPRPIPYWQPAAVPTIAALVLRVGKSYVHVDVSQTATLAVSRREGKKKKTPISWWCYSTRVLSHIIYPNRSRSSNYLLVNVAAAAAASLYLTVRTRVLRCFQSRTEWNTPTHVREHTHARTSTVRGSINYNAFPWNVIADFHLFIIFFSFRSDVILKSTH
jgi:hypothetical protein